ncbi:MAG TPA: hypothetical protein DCQ50_16230 [Chryseobacterium sp.]|nr:hypothetical protein [Chryseobacterium sp.]
MDEKNARIMDLLNKGWSYSQIQEELQVSSKTIAAARKAHYLIMESNTDVLSSETFQLQPKPPPEQNDNQFKPNLIKQNIQKNTKMNTENDDYYEEDDEITSKLELEKYRLKLAHELEMEKLQAAREDKEREYNIRELELKRDNKKAEEDKRMVLFRIKKVIDSCEDAEYSFEEAENLLEEARKVLSESEQYCFINQITFQGSISQMLLNKIISTLIDFLDEMDEDDSADLEFDSAFRRQVSRANFQTF